jgi:hypothetical protein
MTLAVALWLLRSVSAAVWLVEHLALALREHQRGALGVWHWLMPASARWRVGERLGPCVWWGCVGAYATATVLSQMIQ